jgi:hypothetical protein
MDRPGRLKTSLSAPALRVSPAPALRVSPAPALRASCCYPLQLRRSSASCCYQAVGVSGAASAERMHLSATPMTWLRPVTYASDIVYQGQWRR